MLLKRITDEPSGFIIHPVDTNDNIDATINFLSQSPSLAVDLVNVNGTSYISVRKHLDSSFPIRNSSYREFQEQRLGLAFDY